MTFYAFKKGHAKNEGKQYNEQRFVDYFDNMVRLHEALQIVLKGSYFSTVLLGAKWHRYGK